jgi:acetylornithine deacetylase/succinyl-diaminopimelate desuccinylase-like protein
VPAIDSKALTQLVSNQWDRDIVPQLVEYIRLPCKSPHFDPQWQSNGHIEAAVALAERWCRAQAIPGLRLEVLRLEGRTPLLFFEVPGDASRTVLLYGHLDKQRR